jgi:beta-RFAP synthase
MITSPACHLELSPAEQLMASGPDAARTLQFARTYLQSVGVQPFPAVALTITSLPPAHSGLGSGTQLALAVARGLETWLHFAPEDAVRLARRVGRGLRSAVGVHGFQHGGLLVEAGKFSPAEISPLLAHVSLPTAWRWLLASPRQASGLSGQDEVEAFRQLPAVPAQVTSQLRHIAIEQLAPAARAEDFDTFSEAIFAYGQLAGQCFQQRQGGIYCSPAAAAFAEACRALGLIGVGQSSWGPTMFALCPSDEHALRTVVPLQHDPRFQDWEFSLTPTSPRGAQVTTCGDPS